MREEEGEEEVRMGRPNGGCAVAAAIAATLATFAAPAGAATIPVTNDLDQSVNNTTCSLREAITSANTNSNAHEDACVAGQPAPSVDTVDLLGTSYEVLGSGDNSNVTGDFDINTAGGPVIVDGAGDTFSPETGIDADDTDRIFHLDGGQANPVTIRGIVLENAQVTDTAGGIILMSDANLTLDGVVVAAGVVTGTNAGSMRGAGLAAVSAGSLTIRDSFFTDNFINAAGAGAGTVRGGGIFVSTDTSVTIDRSSIFDNHIIGDGVAAGDAQTLRGSGILIEGAERDVTITNSLVAGNSPANGDLQFGGGIDWEESGDDDTLRLTNVTFSGNGVGAGNGGALYANGDAVISHTTFGPNTANVAAGLFVTDGPVQVRNSLFETGSPSDKDCGGSNDLVSLGYNVERGPSEECDLIHATDQILDNQPLMDSLDDNGGPWHTHRLSLDFTDEIPLANCLDAGGAPLTQDARGAPRQVDEGSLDAGPECDPGAYEDVQCQGEPAFVIGTPGADTLTGTAGSEIVLGLGGDDTILPGSGSDRVCAGGGDDTLAGGDGDGASDFYGGGTGSDTYELTDFTAPLTVNLATGAIEPSGMLGNEFIESLENVIGGDDNDTLIGDAGPNRLDGFVGNDTITGAGGSDQLLGNGGNLDALFARDGVGDSVDCGLGTGDTAQTDRLSLDSVTGCESVDALAEPAVLLPAPQPQAVARKRCKKGQKLKRGKCVKKKRKK